MKIIKTTDDIFAKNLRKAINDIKLQEPVLEQDTNVSGAKDEIVTPPKSIRNPKPSVSGNMTIPQIAEKSILKVRSFLVTSSDGLRGEVSASPWNEKLRGINRDIEEALTELDYLAGTLRKFDIFGDNRRQ